MLLHLAMTKKVKILLGILGILGDYGFKDCILLPGGNLEGFAFKFEHGRLSRLDKESR